MNWLIIPVYLLHVATSLFLILVVLLQQGRGADLSVFGGGSTQAAFGARGATLLIHKLTVGSFIMFIVTTLVIGIFSGRSTHAPSLMQDAEAVEKVQGAETEEAVPSEGAADAAVATVESEAAAEDSLTAAPAEGAQGPETEAFTPAEGEAEDASSEPPAQ